MPPVDLWMQFLSGKGTNKARADEAIIFHWLLRLSILACFIGHGTFGIITKHEWVPFFTPFGISGSIALKLMPLIGLMDYFIGIVCFIWPSRVLVVWAMFWCLWTAALRPIAGFSVYETFERAGNYGIPFLLLLSTKTPLKGLRGNFSYLVPAEFTPLLVKKLTFVSLLITASLLAGHGGFGAFLAKSQLIEHWRSIGFADTNGVGFIKFIGALELTAALLVLAYPTKPLFLMVLIWKVFTEFLYPISGSLILETIERSGSYAAPLCLLILHHWNSHQPSQFSDATPQGYQRELSVSQK